MEVLLAGILITLWVRWLFLSTRLTEIEQRLEAAFAERRVDSPDALVKNLSERVAVLERDLAASRRSGFAAPLAAAAVTGGVAAPPAPAPMATPQPQFCKSCGRRLPSPETICACLDADVPPPTWVLTPVPEPQLAVAMSASPTLLQRLRQKMSGEEWEAIVGGSLLNKLGALVLVIGLALFLGYSFTQMSPDQNP